MNLVEQIKKCRLRCKKEFSIILGIAKQARLALQKEKLAKIEVEAHGKKYFFYKTKIGPLRFSRPVREDLYINNERKLTEQALKISKSKIKDSFADILAPLSYTLVQDIASYLDILHPTKSKKTLGTFFESLVAVLINSVTGLEATSGSIRLPGYREKVLWDLLVKCKGGDYLCIATKTSTRERLSQPFVQKLILSKALNKKIKAILVVVGDVQRVKNDKIQHTFTAGQFRLYSKFVEQLDGVYFMDIPPQAESLVSEGFLSPFSRLLRDLKKFTCS